jgi:Protein of unknown function (DUF1203)
MEVYRVTAIPTAIAESVRSTQKAPGYGFPAHKGVAAGRAPCRHCLGLIKLNEEELFLFDYDPFRELGVPPLPGPIYVHARNCERHVETTHFPEEYRGRLLTLDAYGEDRALLKEVRVSGGEEDSAAKRLFAEPAVKYIHVRSTEAGCYLFRLDRV